MSIRGPNWRADCPRCVASKFTCDEHYTASIRDGQKRATPTIDPVQEKSE